MEQFGCLTRRSSHAETVKPSVKRDNPRIGAINEEDVIMSKLSLKMKLGLGFGILLLILCLVGGISYQASLTQRQLAAEVEKQVQKKELALLADKAVEMQLSGLRGFLLAGKDERLKNYEDGRRQFQESMNKLEPMLQTERGKKAFSDAKQAYGTYMPFMDRAIELRRANKLKEAIELIFSADVADKRNIMRDKINEVIQMTDGIKKDAEDTQAAGQARSETLLLTLTGVGLFDWTPYCLLYRSLHHHCHGCHGGPNSRSGRQQSGHRGYGGRLKRRNRAGGERAQPHEK